MSWVRLRQVALVASDLEAAVGELTGALGLVVAYRDPAVAAFGLANAVLPVGCQFIEVVSPTRPGTAAGRQLERAGGDGGSKASGYMASGYMASGYMVICHTDDQPARRREAEAMGVRIAFEADDHGYRIMQLHPGDTGGSFLEIDYQPGGEDPCGPWAPAGPDWAQAAAASQGPARGIAAVTVASRAPDVTAARWARLLGVPVDDSDAGSAVRLANATVHFVDGPLDTLVGVELITDGHFAPRRMGGVVWTGRPPTGPLPGGRPGA